MKMLFTSMACIYYMHCDCHIF